MNNTPVVLWCHPRSVSTAFERAFLQREEEFYCLHEPFGDEYYFGPHRQSPRYKNGNLPKDVKLTTATFESICDEIFAKRSGKRVFVKDMAYHVFYRLKDRKLPMEKMINTFLIRDPQKAVPSMYKCSISASTGWGNFDPSEMGYIEQKGLFDYVSYRCKQTPIVINSQDLVKNPRAVLQKYCELVGVEFKESMSYWQPKKIDKFSKWTGWHECVAKFKLKLSLLINFICSLHSNVEQSTGFSDVQSHNKDLSVFPQIIHKTIDDNLPIYDYLNKYAIKV